MSSALCTRNKSVGYIPSTVLERKMWGKFKKKIIKIKNLRENLDLNHDTFTLRSITSRYHFFKCKCRCFIFLIYV